jgi:CO/xanthine dehydrogenase Mo-binding subunit
VRHSFAAHFSEVEVDAETGEVRVTDYLAAHDSGEIVNRLTAESQVQGGVIMGMGMALRERLIIDPETGSVQNPSLLTYRLTNHVDVPNIHVVFVETTDPFGPKGLGEITCVPVAPAIGNAIFNATGVRLRRLPFTPERLLHDAAQADLPRTS